MSADAALYTVSGVVSACSLALVIASRIFERRAKAEGVGLVPSKPRTVPRPDKEQATAPEQPVPSRHEASSPSPMEVRSINLKDGRMVLEVEFSGFAPETPVEISGSAIQGNEVIATFTAIERVPYPNSDGNTVLYVTAVPSMQVNSREAIKVEARITESSGAVLSASPEEQRTPASGEFWRK